MQINICCDEDDAGEDVDVGMTVKILLLTLTEMLMFDDT